MQKNNDKWIDKKEMLDNLYLDLKNPRIPEYARVDESSVISYLLDNEDVMSIATNIAKNGYHSSAVSITCLEKKRMVVLDGNRRLAACKLLKNPELANKEGYKKKLHSLKRILDLNQIKNIKITIAPSRDTAEKEIWDIHMNPLMKSWQTIQKLRKYRSLIEEKSHTIDSVSQEYGVAKSKMQKDLIKLAFYEKILPMLNTDTDKDKLLKTGFNKIEKIITPNHGKNFLGYASDENTGEIEVLDTKRFNNNLKKITPYILNNINIDGYILGPQCIASDIESVFAFLDPLYKKTTQKKVILSKKGHDSKVVLTNDKIKTTGTYAERDWVTDALYKSYNGSTGSARVKNMLKEMKSFSSLSGYENVSAVSLRVLLELSLYSFLETNGHIKTIIENKKNELKIKNEKLRQKDAQATLYKMQSNWSPSFKEMIDFSIDEENDVITDPQKREAVNTLLKDKKTLKDFIDDLNLFIHNSSYTPTESGLHDLWKKFGRLIFDIIK